MCVDRCVCVYGRFSLCGCVYVGKYKHVCMRVCVVVRVRLYMRVCDCVCERETSYMWVCAYIVEFIYICEKESSRVCVCVCVPFPMYHSQASTHTHTLAHTVTWCTDWWAHARVHEVGVNCPDALFFLVDERWRRWRAFIRSLFPSCCTLNYDRAVIISFFFCLLVFLIFNLCLSVRVLVSRTCDCMSAET